MIMPPIPAQPSRRLRPQGFTLIELLTVIAVIAILAAIIIPATGAVREAAKRSKTQTQFSNYASAIEMYRQEYDRYPTFGEDLAGEENFAFELGTPEANAAFIKTLSGTDPDNPGDPLSPEDRADYNRRAKQFYTFGEDEFNEDDLITDAFGNPNIVVLLDMDRDGYITDNLPDQVSKDSIRGSILIYSDPGEDPNLDFVSNIELD